MARAANATGYAAPIQGHPGGISAPQSQSQDRAVAWLGWLAQLLSDRQWFALYECSASDKGSSKPGTTEILGTWPIATVLPVSLGVYAHRASVSQAPLHITPKSTGNRLAVELSAFPVFTDDRRSWVLCVAGPANDASRRQAMVRLSEWASRHPQFSAYISSTRKESDTESPKSSEGMDALLAKAMVDAMPHHSSTAIATALANGIVMLCGCERVSIGVHTADVVQLIAVSGQATIDKSRQLPQLLLDVMKESVEHDPPRDALRFDSERETDRNALKAHRSLFGINDERPIVTLRLRSSPDYELLAVLERAPNEPLTNPQVEAIGKALHPTGGFLELVDRADASFTERIRRRYHRELARFKSTDTRRRRQIQCALLASVLLIAIIPVPHKVTGNVLIEANDRQVVVAPQAGHIASAHARAGDVVEAGALLATLEGHDLRLEVDKWTVEKVKNNHAYAQALASHDRIELSRLRADAGRIDAELALVEQRLSRSELRAPMSGVLLSGDVSQSLGAPVELGEVLFEVGSETQHRMIIEIDERDVAYVQAQQHADIRMASFPSDVWSATVEYLQPVAVAERGVSHFRLPASLDNEIAALRPGMEGVAKITVGSRSLVWVLTHRPLGTLRYWLWKLGFSR